MPKNTLSYAIEKAKELPRVSGEQRFFCMILDRKGRVLSVGYNSYTKSSPKMMKYALEVGETEKIFWHSECHAISKLPEKSKPHKIIIARVTPGGKTAMAAPCHICLTAIKKAGISVIEHTL